MARRHRDSSLLREEIIEAAARALYVTWWADREEERGISHGGEELTDVAPRTSRGALRLARRFVELFEELNGESVEDLYNGAGKMYGRHDREPTPGEFGFTMAMQGMGSGVAWDDDHPSPGYRLPDVHYYGGDSGEIDARFESRM